MTKDEVAAAPVRSEQIALIEVDDVVFECEREVIFCVSAHQFVLMIESEDVIAHNVFATIVLVESGALAFINDVIFHQDATGPFIEIDPPTSIGV
jgi:hypothetical protein